MIMHLDREVKGCVIAPLRCFESKKPIPGTQRMFWLQEKQTGWYVIIGADVISQIPESARIPISEEGEFIVCEADGVLMDSGEFWQNCPLMTDRGRFVFRLTSDQVEKYLPISFAAFKK